MKKKETKGLLQVHFRGDGVSIQDWDLNKDPEKVASSLHVGWLRDRYDDSNFLNVRIAVILEKQDRGKVRMTLLSKDSIGRSNVKPNLCVASI